MTVTDPYTGIGVITRGVFDSDMAAISLSLHSSCNDIALNEKNSPSFCQIHFYRGIFHLLSSCTLSTLRAFNSSSFHPSSPQIHPFSMIPVTPQRGLKLSLSGAFLPLMKSHSARSAWIETLNTPQKTHRNTGRTPQGVRGLKPFLHVSPLLDVKSHSARSAWIETRFQLFPEPRYFRRTPQGVRGLKRICPRR